jgi:hypothetical protein
MCPNNQPCAVYCDESQNNGCTVSTINLSANGLPDPIVTGGLSMGLAGPSGDTNPGFPEADPSGNTNNYSYLGYLMVTTNSSDAANGWQGGNNEWGEPHVYQV